MDGIKANNNNDAGDGGFSIFNQESELFLSLLGLTKYDVFKES